MLLVELPLFLRTGLGADLATTTALTSIPFLGLVITDSGNCVGIITLGSYGSLYLKKMLGVSIKENGVLSGLPMLSRYLGGLVHAAIADYLLKQKALPVVRVRRVFNSICMVGPALAMLALAFLPTTAQCSSTPPLNTGKLMRSR